MVTELKQLSAAQIASIELEARRFTWTASSVVRDLLAHIAWLEGENKHLRKTPIPIQQESITTDHIGNYLKSKGKADGKTNRPRGQNHRTI